VEDPGIARATNGGGGGASYKRVYRYEARNVRDQEDEKDEESNLGPEIVMNEPIERAEEGKL